MYLYYCFPIQFKFSYLVVSLHRMSNDYYNFVKAGSSSEAKAFRNYIQGLSGEEAKRLYLEEIRDVKSKPATFDKYTPNKCYASTKNVETVDISDQDLFLAVQVNNLETLIKVLNNHPNKINIVDSYGWSLLMIACQACSVDAVKELLKHGADTSIRDKAENSALSLIIKNRNLELANLFLKHSTKPEKLIEHPKVPMKEIFVCDICDGKSFHDKQEHLVSTIHNINASKGKKIPTNYLIPESNKGYQIMLKVGWNKESGLGPLGSGNKYPIKTIPKQDRKGLGHKKKAEKSEQKSVSKKIFGKQFEINRRKEIDFRRQFYDNI